MDYITTALEKINDRIQVGQDYVSKKQGNKKRALLLLLELRHRQDCLNQACLIRQMLPDLIQEPEQVFTAIWYLHRMTGPEFIRQEIIQEDSEVIRCYNRFHAGYDYGNLKVFLSDAETLLDAMSRHIMNEKERIWTAKKEKSLKPTA